MDIRKNSGITIIILVITIILLLIIGGISLGVGLNSKEEITENKQLSELEMIQNALLQRYTKSQLTKEDLPGTIIQYSELQSLIQEINDLASNNIELKGKQNEYKELAKNDLKELGFAENKISNDVYVVNYSTGEVINKTKKVSNNGKALYTYSISNN